MSKKSTIDCDICGIIVASKDCDCFFCRFITKKPYIKVPYNYVGVELEGDFSFSCNAKKDYYICEDCVRNIKNLLNRGEE